jgi:outer membrane protein
MNNTAYTSHIRNAFRICLILTILVSAGSQAFAQQEAPLSLKEIKDIAQQQNQLLHISKYKITEKKDSVANARSNYYPKIAVSALDMYDAKSSVDLDALGFAGAAGSKAFSSQHNLFIGQLQAQQPLTQLFKISTGVKISENNVQVANENSIKAQWQVGQNAEKLYYNILIGQKQLVQANINIELLKAQRYDIQSALLAGKTDSVNYYNLEAQLASQQQRVLVTQNQLDNLKSDLNVLLGRQAGSPLNVSDVIEPPVVLQPITYYEQQAAGSNPDIKIAGLTGQKAALAVDAAKKEYIPNLSVFAGYSRQDAVDFIVHDNFSAGLTLSWTILDWGARSSIVHQRQTQVREAAENLSYVQQNTLSIVAKSYRNAAQQLLVVEASEKAVQYRRRELLIRKNSRLAGKALKQDVLSSENELAQAEVDYFSAQLNYRIAVVEIEIAAGVYQQ